MISFDHIRLRTSDIAAARTFYKTILGQDDLEITKLPAEAVARGAPAHWLGHLGVEDVEAVASKFIARGAVRLGLPPTPETGGEVTVLRDPGGAVIGLVKRSALLRTQAVWHHLNTHDAAQAITNYSEILGWQPTKRFDLGRGIEIQEFAGDADGESIGSIADIAGRPGVHPHWLFHFRVPALEPALAEIRAAGGLVIDAISLPGGNRVAVCDDPQGAAFALRE